MAEFACMHRLATPVALGSLNRAPSRAPVAHAAIPRRAGGCRSARGELFLQRSSHTAGRKRLVCHAKIEKLTAEELEVAITERDRPMIIDFFASWCGPCLLLAQELEKVAEEMGDSVRIIKIDTEEEDELATQLQIQGLPTMVFIGVDKSKPALRTEGLLPAETIQDIIKKELMA